MFSDLNGLVSSSHSFSFHCMPVFYLILFVMIILEYILIKQITVVILNLLVTFFKDRYI